MQIDGRCLCGHITYEAEIDPERVAICHCTDCQTHSASAYGVVAHIAGEFRLLSGEMKTYEKIADSGTRRALTFCPAKRYSPRSSALAVSAPTGTATEIAMHRSPAEP